MAQKISHQQQIKSPKYRNWVKAGLGLKYLKEGIENFTEDVVQQQHADIITRVKQKHGLTVVNCGQCTLRSLQADHVRNKNKQCPLGQLNCNCQYPGGKMMCQNSICGTIYDQIILNHSSQPPCPYWKNTDPQQWCTDAWSVARCFINAPGYETKANATELDSTGLLHLFINSKYMQTRIQCKITGNDVFSKVRASRNTIYHSSCMEMEDTELNDHIDDIIAVLEDGKELINRIESKAAVLKLKEEHSSIKRDIEELQSMRSMQQARLDYINRKRDFQNRLLQMYKESIVKVSPVLLQPERTDIDIDQLYVEPWIEVKQLNKKPRTLSFRQIFNRDNKKLKQIYVIGEAGSGKSVFCKNMVNNWCLAHSEENQSSCENVQEMLSFQFLFYISLRHNIGADSVETMIKTQYDDPFIDSILENESASCLILLDGLDEWTPTSQGTVVSQFQTKGVPVRNPVKGYTILITSRPWKVESLGLKSSEIDQKLLLRGVYDYEAMAENTIKELNKIQNRNKTLEEFEQELLKCPVESEMMHLPFLLQQLICLWFDGKLITHSRTMLYTNMLSLFLEWTEQRHPNDPFLVDIKENSQVLEGTSLPQQLSDIEIIQDYKRVIYDTSRLAHKTLFSDHREASLSFDISLLQTENIPNVVVQCCLKAGILSREREISLNLSKKKRILFCFVHKSVQEYLSAVYVFTELKTKFPEFFNLHNEILLNKMHGFREYLGNCNTVKDILDQSNVITFLCGFDVFLATFITRYIYHIALKDESFVDSRTNLIHELFLITDKLGFLWALRRSFSVPDYGHNANILGLQNLVFKIIKESEQQEEKIESRFSLADFVYKEGLTGDVTSTKFITAKSIVSINICLPQKDEKLFLFLSNPDLGKSVSTLKIRIPLLDYLSSLSKYVNVISNFILRCISTLQCLVICSEPNYFVPFCGRHFLLRNIISFFPNMSKLTSVELDNIKLPTMLLGRLCSFLTHATYLRQICLRKVRVRDEFEEGDIISADLRYINLSSHHQLQSLDHDFHTINMYYFNVVNLETCALKFPSYSTMVSSFRVLKRSRKLKHMFLSVDSFKMYASTKKVTRLFRELLPCLEYLTTLVLSIFSFDDTVIASPLEMKRLRKISFSDVSMEDETFGKFIDSILLAPCNIQVEIFDTTGEIRYFRSLSLRRKKLHNFESYGDVLRFSTKSVDI